MLPRLPLFVAHHCTTMALANGYGPSGLANSVYADPYGGSVARPTRRISVSSGTTGARRRISPPPHDWTATMPHPSGNHLSASGTWRKGYTDRHVEGVADFHNTVNSLLHGTRPESPPDKSVRPEIVGDSSIR